MTNRKQLQEYWSIYLEEGEAHRLHQIADDPVGLDKNYRWFKQDYPNATVSRADFELYLLNNLPRLPF